MFNNYEETARESEPSGLTLAQMNKGPAGADLIQDIYWEKFATDAVKVLILDFSPHNLISNFDLCSD